MITRRLRPYIENRLGHMPGVVLLGPRQVGKTTLARTIASRRTKTSALYLDLERPADQRRLQDADAFLRSQAGKLVVIDEIHRAPTLFEVLRGSLTTGGLRVSAPDIFFSWGPRQLNSCVRHQNRSQAVLRT